MCTEDIREVGNFGNLVSDLLARGSSGVSSGQDTLGMKKRKRVEYGR